MSDVNAYAAELVSVFGFNFPLLPVYSNARSDSGIYTHDNSLAETITPARHAASSETPAPVPVQARRVRFNVPQDNDQQGPSNGDFCVQYPRIIPGGINTEYVSHPNITNIFLSFSQTRHAPVHQIQL
jgi:hypothetical protein